MKQNRKTFIAFDQYQRYETIARIINFYRESTGKDVFRILEVGANEHKDMKLFLPDDTILFTDIVLTESMQNNPEFMAADGTALPFDDGSFDFIFAADVLEHIPAKDRKKFLSESCRVARKCVILSFPFQSPDVVDAEARINSYYKAISGQDFIWLHEHQENGLPKLQEINNNLDQLGYNYFSFFHGDIKTWEKMWYCHFDTVFAPETLEYRESIDHYYNCNLYNGDISDSCYRAFYVMPHELFDEVKEYVSTMWKPAAQGPTKFLTVLLQAHGHMHPLFMQNRLQEELTKKEVQIQNLNAMHQRTEEQSSRQAERLELCLQQQEADQQLLAEQAKRLQQYQAQQESDAQAIAEQAEQLARYLQQQEADRQLLTEQAERLQQYQAQQESDAQEIKEQAEQIKQYCLEQESDRQSLASAEKHCDEVEKELAHYKEHYFAAINQRENLTQQLAQVQNAYNVISNAFFWKITKPFRFTLDGLKSLLKKNYYTHLICKGLKSWKNNGFSYTWKKVKDKNYRKRHLLKAGQPAFTQEELEKQRTNIFPQNIKFSILVPLYNTPEQFLREMIQSVLNQSYENWELCMADGSDAEHRSVERICGEYAEKDGRIQYRRLEKNLGISENTNACIEMASGEYIALFDHDDLLHPMALHNVMNAICTLNADFIYTDENTFRKKPEDAYCPHYKADFAPDTLRSYNYICHLSVFSKKLLEKVGNKFRPEFDGSQDYDMMLRLTEKAERVVHIPEILYYWRSHDGSVASDVSAKPYTLIAAKRALAEHLQRIGLNGKVYDSRIPSTYRIQYELKESPLVSILIPNKDHIEDLLRCVNSIKALTTYPSWEIIIIENNSTEQETFAFYEELQDDLKVRVVHWEREFNYSAINNFGAQYARGEYLLLLNNDTEVITPDWIEQMLMFCQRKDVGATGAMLYYPDDTIQHAGVIVGLGGVAGHSHKYFKRGEHGYAYRLTLAQNLSAVTAACMMVRRAVWNELDGLDEEFAVAFNDVDFCMRIRKAGYLIVWTPYAELYHYESKSRGLEDTPEKQARFAGEIQRFQSRWAAELAAGDPYYNLNLTLEREDFSIK